MRPHIPNVYTRFMAKVDTHSWDASACWEWLGATKGNGYGHFKMPDGSMPAHRAAYELFCAEVPAGIDVCHACDNRTQPPRCRSHGLTSPRSGGLPLAL